MEGGVTKILISAGHTNDPRQDRGAAGNGFIEGVEAVKIRDSVAAKLRSRGFLVIEDGADGVNDPLKKAIALARTADIAVEFHFNAGQPTAKGVEVLSKSNNRKLGQAIAKAIGDSLTTPLRGDEGWKSDSSGQHHRLGFCEAGGLIVEVGFISNKGDMDAYTGNFEAMCDAVAVAIGSAAVPAGGNSSSLTENAGGVVPPAGSVGDTNSAAKPPIDVHTVVSGDNLWTLASKYQISVSELMHINGLKSDRILPGQRLKIR